eukprot:GFUD01006974.1.p1 GENE.GFUD01006974.1~~GFUD01006974.1.p1  ORF type:complete len:703 (-),score=133.76 GFUD01006974.1:54-2162(-)
MGAGGEQNILETFKLKISECITMVGIMGARDRISAVEFWNNVSEKLQEVIDNSMEEIEKIELEIKSPEVLKQSPSYNNHRIIEDEETFENSKLKEKLNTSSNLEHFKSVEHLIGVEHQYHFLVEAPPNDLPKKGRTVAAEESGVVNADLLKTSESKTVFVGFQEDDVNTLILGQESGQSLILSGESGEPVRILPNNITDDEIIHALDHDDPINNDDLSSEHGEDGMEVTNLSGQVLIVGENHLPIIEEEILPVDGDISNNILNEMCLKNGPKVGQEITVTGEDGLKHKIQFELSHQEEGSEDEETLDDVKDINEITPEMAGVQTVTIESNPPSIDESMHKISRTNPDGTAETLYQCEHCHKTFITSASLTSHRWQHTKPFQCEQCKQRFASKGNLVIHRRRHTGEKPFGCHMCDSKFSTKGNLKRHTQTHSGIKPWACNQCEGRFTEKKSLKIHMRKHTGERPYVCRVCGKRFAQTSILRSHLAMHLDKRAHLCDLCGRSFRQKSQLRLHVQRHTGVKKFDCLYCESKFLTKGDLERHVKSHMGTRDFSCELCSKTFTRQQTLNEHMNRHYGLRPYECKVCGKSFSEMSTVYKHIKSHEKGKVEEPTEEQIIIHDLPSALELTDIVHHTVDDPELSEVPDDLMEDVVIGMEDNDNAVIDMEQDEKKQFIYLETTGLDGSVSITEATVDQDGNLRINENESCS